MGGLGAAGGQISKGSLVTAEARQRHSRGTAETQQTPAEAQQRGKGTPEARQKHGGGMAAAQTPRAQAATAKRSLVCIPGRVWSGTHEELRSSGSHQGGRLVHAASMVVLTGGSLNIWSRPDASDRLVLKFAEHVSTAGRVELVQTLKVQGFENIKTIPVG